MLSSLVLPVLLAACGGTPPPVSPAGDADGDGLSDADEARLGSDPNNPDSDGDGKHDGDEVHHMGTDPTKKDSDGDGVADGAEARAGTDPTDPDSHPEIDPNAGKRRPGPDERGPDEAMGTPEVRTPLRMAGVYQPDGSRGEAPPAHMQCRFDKEDLETCFVKVPGGTFWMGAQSTDPKGRNYDPAALPSEGPVRQVTLSPYWMHRDEVIVTIFLQCLEAGWCQLDDVDQGGFSTFKGEGVVSKSSMPLNSISWDRAAHMCDFLGARLPTEAEWAFAARGPTSRRFPWGDEPGCGVPTQTGFQADGRRLQASMQRDTCTNDGPRPPRDLMGDSPFGLRGMAGNVWEWTLDGYADRYDADDVDNPRGPENAERRVQRGGGWTSLDPLELRAATRVGMKPDRRVNDVGLRCVWEASDAP